MASAGARDSVPPNWRPSRCVRGLRDRGSVGLPSFPILPSTSNFGTWVGGSHGKVSRSGTVRRERSGVSHGLESELAQEVGSRAGARPVGPFAEPGPRHRKSRMGAGHPWGRSDRLVEPRALRLRRPQFDARASTAKLLPQGCEACRSGPWGPNRVVHEPRGSWASLGEKGATSCSWSDGARPFGASAGACGTPLGLRGWLC